MTKIKMVLAHRIPVELSTLEDGSIEVLACNTCNNGEHHIKENGVWTCLACKPEVSNTKGMNRRTFIRIAKLQGCERLEAEFAANCAIHLRGSYQEFFDELYGQIGGRFTEHADAVVDFPKYGSSKP